MTNESASLSPSFTPGREECTNDGRNEVPDGQGPHRSNQRRPQPALAHRAGRGATSTDEGIEADFVIAPQRGHVDPQRRIGTDERVTGLDLMQDPKLVDSIGVHLIFEEGACELYRACEWGQVRRTQDSQRGGLIVGKRAAVSTQAILVRPDSPINYPQHAREQGRRRELPRRLALPGADVPRRLPPARRDQRRPRRPAAGALRGADGGHGRRRRA